MTLSLPIVVGKKYVRRDGVVAFIQRGHSAVGKDELWAGNGRLVCDAEQHVNAKNGRVWTSIDSPADLVADYIEPAKGHPHAALMAQFAEDAQTNADPLSLWQWRGEDGVWYDWEDDGRIKSCAWHADHEYRRRPTVTPDPHAENAAEYAKDMALSDKAWEGWECRDAGTLDDWTELYSHPAWGHDTQYRRKEQA